MPAHQTALRWAGLPGPLVIEHYRGENGRKFDVEKQTNKFGVKLTALNKNVAQMCTRFRTQKAKRKQTEKRNSNLETVVAHAPGHERTNVRREHQAPTHAQTSEQSTKCTAHIQQWGSRPLSLASWQGPAKRFANLNDLETIWNEPQISFAYGLRSLWSRSSHRGLPEFLQARFR